jgi:ribosomal protein S18 acetylase RimI-like enzyme
MHASPSSQPHGSIAQCGLTLRSSGPPPAWRTGREAVLFLICLATSTPTRRGPLSSNVRRHEMHPLVVEPSREEEATLNAFLDDRVYEFNVELSGFQDGRAFQSVVRDEANNIVAAINGHTWGGCCQIVYLWVHPSKRRSGLGSSLLLAAEGEGRARNCAQALLFTHSFQAPAFYEKLGYIKVATVPNFPQGHAQFVYAKALQNRGDA